MEEVSFVDYLAQVVGEKYGEFLNRRQVRELVDFVIEESSPVFHYYMCKQYHREFLQLAKTVSGDEYRQFMLHVSNVFDVNAKHLKKEIDKHGISAPS